LFKIVKSVTKVFSTIVLNMEWQMQYKEVGDFCLDMLGIQILLTERNVFKNKTWGEKTLKKLPNEKNN
jgi:hypothetical protein